MTKRLAILLLAATALAAPQNFRSSQGGARQFVPQDAQFDGSSSNSNSNNFNNQFTTTTTQGPVAKILKQINQHNQDGSYTFGYESQDGTFRVETRGVDGITRGKYGYLDQNGKLKEVEYTAGTETGYEPKGTGIQVPPRPPKRQKDPFENDYDDEGTPIRSSVAQQQLPQFQPQQSAPVQRHRQTLPASSSAQNFHGSSVQFQDPLAQQRQQQQFQPAPVQQQQAPVQQQQAPVQQFQQNDFQQFQHQSGRNRGTVINPETFGQPDPFPASTNLNLPRQRQAAQQPQFAQSQPQSHSFQQSQPQSQSFQSQQNDPLALFLQQQLQQQREFKK